MKKELLEKDKEIATLRAEGAESPAGNDTILDLDVAGEKPAQRPVKETLKITLYFSTDLTKDSEDQTEIAGVTPSVKKKMEAAQEYEDLAEAVSPVRDEDLAEAEGTVSAESLAGKQVPSISFHVELLSAIENLLVGAGGTILYMDYGLDPSLPASITATLPPAHLEGFIETLGQIGVIETAYEIFPDEPAITEKGMIATDPTLLEVPAEEPSVWIRIYPQPSPEE
jgi:hypothetical protein